MKRLALALLLAASLLPLVSARADAATRPADALKAARAATVVPTDWDGLWNSADSTYTCGDGLQSTGASLDTICGGKDYVPPSEDSPLVFECTGTADATTMDMTCTASQEVFTNCTATFTIVMHATRSGDTAYSVNSITTSYSGTGAGCDLFPSSCTQINSHATRTGPAPTDYCSTPARTTRWGDLKLLYR